MRARPLVTSVCAVCACLVVPAMGRSPVRGRAIFTIPGQLGTIGVNSDTYNFNTQAFGLGSLGGAGRTGGGSVLRSSIAGSTFSLQSNLLLGTTSPLRSSISSLRSVGRGGMLGGTALQGGAGMMGRPRTGIGRRAAAINQGALIFGGGDIRNAILSADPALSVARAYLHNVGPTDLTSGKGADKPISSLVPSQPSQYASFLAVGEKSFQAGRFSAAFNYFERASYIAPQAPETLLSLLHARFATSSVAYAAAAHYLRLALKHLPELPLAPLKPKLFYGTDSTAMGRYVLHLERLEKHLARVPDDVDALLVLAYFRWFSGRTDETKAALAAAMKIAREDGDKQMAEAIDTFWTAMVRTEKVTGGLLSVAPPRGDSATDGAP